MEFYASCALGFEKELAQELKSLSLKSVRPLKGGVEFLGGLKDAYTACMYSRLASRIYLTLERFSARDADELYDGMYQIPWEEHISKDGSFAIHAQGTNDELRNTQFIAVKAKDALVDRMRDKTSARPNVELKRPDVNIRVKLNNSRATVSIDLSGEPLHVRGYRTQGKQSEAPLKENLAAFVLSAGKWYRHIRKERPVFIDPMCGSGTLCIEAALQALDRAPGLTRSYWGFDGWLKHDEELFLEVLDEAEEKAEQNKIQLKIYASDIDGYALSLAKENAKRAGVLDYIEFKQISINELEFSKQFEGGLLATNPPYGERMLNQAQLPAIYAALQRLMQSEALSNVDTCCISGDVAFEQALALKPESKQAVKNGPIDARVYYYPAHSHAEVSQHIYTLASGEKFALLLESSEQFVNRLQKVYKQRKKWAKREGISAYRLYDQDLPDYAVAIDVYEGAAQDEDRRLVQLSEYQAPKQIEEELAQTRLLDAINVTKQILSLDDGELFVKQRRRAKGGSQYGKEGSTPYELITQENGHFFKINPAQYLDTGLFLDHRLTRELVQSLAKDKRFLNLFSYTSSASVYAAKGGAFECTSVDLSNTYLEWSEENFKLNKLNDKRRYTFIRADVLSWLDEMRHSKNRWDLIFCDPPTFSNSKAMASKDFEVQRDHVELLIGLSRLLTEGGLAIFSCNLRNFKIDEEALLKAGVLVEDISAQTIPEDFSRRKNIHHCFYVRRKK